MISVTLTHYSKKSKHNYLLSKLTDAFELPQEVVLNLPRLILTGNTSLFIENYKSVLTFEPDAISIITTSGVLAIKGDDLSIKGITLENCLVEGTIKSLEYK
jgi:sporulation protein YqfC